MVPVYDPAPEWDLFFPALIQAVAESGLSLHVRVVGDGNSEPNRLKIETNVAEARARWPGVLKPSRHRASNNGKGAAVYFGWEGAEEDWLGFVDSDGAVAPDEVIRLARMAFSDTSGARAWLASRQPEAGPSVKRAWHRQALGHAFAFLVRVLTGLRIRDSQCGLKWVPTQAYQAVKAGLVESRFVFDVELLARLRDEGVDLREVAIAWSDASRSTIRLWRDGPAMLWGLARVAARIRLGRSLRPREPVH